AGQFVAQALLEFSEQLFRTLADYGIPQRCQPAGDLHRGGDIELAHGAVAVELFFQVDHHAHIYGGAGGFVAACGLQRHLPLRIVGVDMDGGGNFELEGPDFLAHYRRKLFEVFDFNDVVTAGDERGHALYVEEDGPQLCSGSRQQGVDSEVHGVNS